MIIDGTALAQNLLAELADQCRAYSAAPELVVFSASPSLATTAYIALKIKKATQIGMVVRSFEWPPTATTDSCLASLRSFVEKKIPLIIQLPLPAHIDTAALLAAIPPELDADAFHYPAMPGLLPPVVGAIEYISRTHALLWRGKKVLVVGQGKLVGKPAALFAREQGAHVTVVTKDGGDLAAVSREADLIILGAGVPRLLRPDMIKDGVVIFDAGTSEEGGVLVGDADPLCAEKAALFTPVPGGIGPLTVAYLLKNTLTLTRQNSISPVKLI